MTKKILLGSCLNQVIHKMTFLFKKPLNTLKIICIPTAANLYPDENKAWFFEELSGFTNLGITLTHYDITGKTESDIAETIKDADAVYVTGGNTYYLLEQMQKCGFKSAITNYLNAGGLYIGASAGSVATCPTIDFIGDMDDAGEANLTDYTGLGLIDFNIMPHMDHPKYANKARGLIEKYKNSTTSFIGLRDDQLILITDNYVEFY